MDLLGTGIESYIGIGQETTYGTAVSPAEFFQFDSEQNEHNTNEMTFPAVLGRPFELWEIVNPPRQVARMTFPLWMDGMGTILKYAMGDYYDNTVEDTTNGVYLHEFRMARYIPSMGGVIDPTYKSMTVTIARGSSSNTSYIYGFMGYLFSGFRLNIAASGGTMELDGIFRDSTQTAVAPDFTIPTSYTSKYLAQPTTLSVGVGDHTSGDPTLLTALTVYGLTLTVSHQIEVEYPLGLNGGTTLPVPTSPFRRGLATVRGTLDVLAETDDKTFTIGNYTLKAIQDGRVPVNLDFTIYGETVTGTVTRRSHHLQFKKSFLNGIAPAVNQAGPVRRTISFAAVEPTLSTDNPLRWLWRSNDATFGV